MDIICPNCDAELERVDKQTGDKAKCPICNTYFTIPDRDNSIIVFKKVPKSIIKSVPILKAAKTTKYYFKECPYCAETIKMNAKVCKHCGYTIDQRLRNLQDDEKYYQRCANQPGVSRLAFILLGLFLGGLGIHNFYAGYTERGVAQLLITICSCGWLWVFVGIWVIIEICVVDVDASGRRMS